ncbi:MAG: hypothetical protein AAB556_01950 [Patescibacteria group bacterium]
MKIKLVFCLLVICLSAYGCENQEQEQEQEHQRRTTEEVENTEINVGDVIPTTNNFKKTIRIRNLEQGFEYDSKCIVFGGTETVLGKAGEKVLVRFNRTDVNNNALCKDNSISFETLRNLKKRKRDHLIKTVPRQQLAEDERKLVEQILGKK